MGGLDKNDENRSVSRAERLIDELKSSPRAFQFGIKSLLILSVVSALGLMVPRILDLSYALYFMRLYMLAFGCAPMIAWVTYMILPKLFGRLRIVCAAFVLLALIAPLLGILAAKAGVIYVLQILLVSTILLWIPQTLAIAGVYWLLFSRNPIFLEIRLKRRIAQRRRRANSKDLFPTVD